MIWAILKDKWLYFKLKTCSVKQFTPRPLNMHTTSFSHSSHIFYKDMKRFVRYVCSCACFYPETDECPNQCEDGPTSETMIHFAQEIQAKTQCYNATNSEATTTDEVQHHKSPIETTKECQNPMHSAITLPPAPVVAMTLDAVNSPSSSSDDDDTIRINISDVEDFSVNANTEKDDPWHVL